MINLHDFFARPYWRRLWIIIQELAMGHAGMPIICGPTITQWRYVRDAVMLLSSALDVFDELTTCALVDHKERPKVAEMMYTQLNLGRNTNNLEKEEEEEKEMKSLTERSLLHVTTIAQLECSGHRKQQPSVDIPLPDQVNAGPQASRNGSLMGSTVRLALRLINESHCFEPRDRIYGMLAIPGIPEFDIEVSYSENRTAGDFYTDFARACIRKPFAQIFSIYSTVAVVLRTTIPCPLGAQISTESPRPAWGSLKVIGVLAVTPIFLAVE